MAAFSGQITITVAGIAVQGPNVSGSSFIFTTHPGNAGTVCWMGNDGEDDVSNTTGYPIPTGQQVPRVPSEPNLRVNLNQYWFDSDTNGDKICWIRLQ